VTWRAVHTIPNGEPAAKRQLERYEVDVLYLFKRVTRRRKRPRQQSSILVETEQPLFSRYLFAELPDRLLMWMDRMPAVSGIVGMFGAPLMVPELVVRSLQALGTAVYSEEATPRYLGHCVGRENLTKLSERLRWSVGQRVIVDNKDSVLNGFIAEISDVSRMDTHGEIRAFVDLFGARREATVVVGSLVEVGA
jgi:transcription antitermination factor NusG